MPGNFVVQQILAKLYMLLNCDWIQRQLLFLTAFCTELCVLVTAQSPALDIRNWIQHSAADEDANSHHVERVVVAVGDIIQPTCASISNK